MLRWSSVQLMSMGRVCTCGHTAGAGLPLALHRLHHLLGAVGHGGAVEQRRQRRGDAVGAGELAQHLDARHRQARVEELVHDLQHAAALAEHGAQRLQLGVAGPARRHRAQVLLDVDVARRHARRRRRRGRPAAGRTSRRSPPRWPAGGRRRRARRGAARSGRQAGATFRAMSAATASTMPSNDSPQRQSTPCSNAAAGISSISRNMREKRSRWAGRTGAMLERAVAGDDRRDAVLDGRVGVRVEQHLGVVVGVGVDEPGGHDLAGGVDDTRAASPSVRPTLTMRPPATPTSPR